MTRYLIALIFWFNFIIVTLVLFLWLLLVVGYYRLFDRDNLSLGAHSVAIFWGRSIMQLTPGWHYRVHGLENLPKFGEAPVVMVANHQSAADIWALYLTGAQFRWLSKDDVFKVPLIGLAMKWAGYVPISRGKSGSHAAALRASSQWIRRGISMVFFPEGTRSEDGHLKEFKIGAFRLAVEEKVDILPLVIQGTRDMVQKKSAIPCPARLDIQVMPRISPNPEESIEEFATRVQRLISHRLKERTGPSPNWTRAKKDPREGILSKQ